MDRWIGGEIGPCFISDVPPGSTDPRMADWFAGVLTLPEKWLPRHAVNEPADDPEWQRVAGQSFPFRIDRRQLETALRAAGAAANSPEPPPTSPPHTPEPVHTSSEHLPDRLRWDGVLLLAEAVPRLWPDLAEQIHDYMRNIGRLHLRKPNPGAPGGERVVLEIVETDAELAPSGDDVQERWVDIADIPGDDVSKLEVPPPYKVPNPHPGEELLSLLRELTKNGPNQLVFRRADDFGARWEPVLTDQFYGLDDGLFDYELSCYGSARRQRMTESYQMADDYPPSDREAVAYRLGIRCVEARQPSSSEKTEAEVEIDRPSAAERHKAEPASGTSETSDDGQPEAPHDTVALRGKAKKWLAAHVAARKHRDRGSTLEAMRAAYPGLGVRGSLAVWGEFAKENPHLQLSRRGAKLKRNTNN